MELLNVIGQNKELIKKRVELARRLGHKKILLLAAKADVFEHTDVTWAILAKNTNEVSGLKKYGKVFAPAKREFFEHPKVDYILNPEEAERSDFIHHRNSGLNQVLLKLCVKNRTEVITSFSLLLGKKRELYLGRMMQNATFCRKYGVPYHITSGTADEWEQRDEAILKALGRELLKK